VYERINIAKNGPPAVPLTWWKMRLALVLVAALAATARDVAAQTQPVVTAAVVDAATTRARVSASPAGPAVEPIALIGPATQIESAQAPNTPAPPVPMPPRAFSPRAPADSVPRVIPLEPIPGANDQPARAPEPRVIQFPTDSSGMVPDHPPLLSKVRTNAEVAADLSSMIETVNEPEAEISLIEGHTKLIQSRHELTRIVISNPLIADIELLNDQPNSRLVNLYGKAVGTTSLTMWDQTNRPVSFLVRVTLDTKDLASRIRQAFPGADVKVRQVGPQIILDGQVPDSKTMSDIIHLVSFTLMTSPSIQRMAGGGGGGGGGGMGGGGGGTSGGMAGGTGGGAGGRGAMMIINRLTVPGPRQVMLHVKIAEINRSATRSLGVSWLYARGQSLIGSSPGSGGTNAVGGITTTATAAYNQASNAAGFVKPIQGTFGGSATAAPSANSPLFGVFNAGHFSLFIEALRSNSLAKILAEPNLVALDGQPARFLVGGMFPFPVPQSSSIPGGTAVVTVQFQRFGVILTFLPEILPNDVIRLDVEPVISELNFAQSTTVNGGTVPSITERSARTVVELREGQSLAIAGLLQLTTNATSLRVPGLGDLPIVGSWFSTNTIETIEIETVVIVTPELVSPLEKNEVTEAPGDRVYQPNDPEFFLLGRIEGKLGREFRATKGEQDPLNLMKHFQSEQQWVVGPHGHAD
jgi:pilus assembly protein CpaC